MHANVAVERLGQSRIERRERRPVSLRAFARGESGTGVEVLVLDLSYEGCGIETQAAFGAGERLELSVLGLGVIQAVVRWCEDGKAGLVFEGDEAEAEAQYWPRRSERVELTAEVSLRRLGKFNYRVRVFDVSPHGCKVELVEMPRLEEHVLVRFEGLEALEAEVCWIEGMTAGLRFEKPIHPAVFALLLERLA
ncbi:MAG TPA: PilZ domain-containing protein [Sphingomicrobium sp.]|nr:PilZ domain-containing protein [Sphingomicrobium sp.]